MHAHLTMQTPEFRNQQTARDEFAAFVQGIEEQGRQSFHAENIGSQLQAMLAHDVAAAFGGSLEAVAEVVRSDVLTVIGTQDHVVTPDAARAFTARVGGRVLELDSPCGHVVFVCETARIATAVNEFLATPPDRGK